MYLQKETTRKYFLGSISLYEMLPASVLVSVVESVGGHFWFVVLLVYIRIKRLAVINEASRVPQRILQGVDRGKWGVRVNYKGHLHAQSTPAPMTSLTIPSAPIEKPWETLTSLTFSHVTELTSVC